MIALGLGANMGDRAAFLAQAVRRLSAHMQGMKLSPIYETPALLLPDSPPEWDIPYLNMVVAGDTRLAPLELLRALKALERELGRRARGRWAPREIDIDILVWDDVTMDTPELMIPHKFLAERPFAIVPLADIAPGWRWPGQGVHAGKTAEALAQSWRADKSLRLFALTLPEVG